MTPPSKIRLHKLSQQLELHFAEDVVLLLSAEFLRVHSPSAEVKGHGVGQEVLQFGKKAVQISQLEPAGHYGIKIHFDDGHNTGIYTWDYFYELGKNYEQFWNAYLEKLHQSGKSREPDAQVVKFIG